MTSCLICSYSVGTSRLRFLSMYHLKFISMLMYLKAHCCMQSYTLPRHGRVLSSLPICLKAPTNPLYCCSVGVLRIISLLKYIDNYAYLIESRCSWHAVLDYYYAQLKLSTSKYLFHSIWLKVTDLMNNTNYNKQTKLSSVIDNDSQHNSVSSMILSLCPFRKPRFLGRGFFPRN